MTHRMTIEELLEKYEGKTIIVDVIRAGNHSYGEYELVDNSSHPTISMHGSFIKVKSLKELPFDRHVFETNNHPSVDLFLKTTRYDEVHEWFTSINKFDLLLKKKRTTRYMLAKASGVAESTLSRLVSGERSIENLSFKTIKALTDTLELTNEELAELFEGTQ